MKYALLANGPKKLDKDNIILTHCVPYFQFNPSRNKRK